MSKFKIKDALALAVDEDFQLSDLDPDSTPGFSGDEDDARERGEKKDDDLYDLQELLFANSRAYGEKAPSILLVLQGMDTSGKGGVIRNTLNVFDPQGIDTVGFGKPTEEELAHDFLWRIRKHVPKPGQIVAFDRSHYEDVLIQRVHKWVDEDEIERRFEAIQDFERELVANGTRIIKVMLHISKDFQKENFLDRLEKPEKHWKYNPGDIDEREHWDAYMDAYQDAVVRTSTEDAPWYVIPSDNKPYARMVIKFLLLDALQNMDLEWPTADFDVEAELERAQNLE